MPTELTKEQCAERAQLVRLYEASAGVDYPSVDELNFRIALMKRIGLSFGLREVQPLTITGPATAENLRSKK